LERTFGPLTDPETGVANALLGGIQFSALEKQLKQLDGDPEVHSVLVASGVPLLFFDETLSRIAYRFENPKEKYPGLPEPFMRSSLLSILELFRHSRKNITLLAGDIHQYVDSTICYREEPLGLAKPGDSCLRQVISSGVTNGSAVINELKLLLFFALGKHFTEGRVGNWVTANVQKQWIDNNYVVMELLQQQQQPQGALDKQLQVLHMPTIDVRPVFRKYPKGDDGRIDRKLRLAMFEHLPLVMSAAVALTLFALVCWRS
jgi:hypothetical protein